MRTIALALVLALSVFAQTKPAAEGKAASKKDTHVLPATLLGGTQTDLLPAAFPDAELAKELGMVKAESASYVNGANTVDAVAYRFADATTAYVAKLHLIALDPKMHIYQSANFVLHVSAPLTQTQVDEAFAKTPGRQSAELPPLPSWMPAKGRVPNSEHFVIGPVSAARSKSPIPVADMRFDLSTEALVATYMVDGKPEVLTALNFLTPQMARAAEKSFQGRQGYVVKRTGPVVSVFVAPQNARAAEAILNGVDYKADYTGLLWVPKVGPTPYAFIMAFIQLFFIIGGICVGVGVALALFRAWRRSRPGYKAEPAYIEMHLND